MIFDHQKCPLFCSENLSKGGIDCFSFHQRLDFTITIFYRPYLIFIIGTCSYNKNRSLLVSTLTNNEHLCIKIYKSVLRG